MKANPLRRPTIVVVAAALCVPAAVFGWSSRARVFRALPRRGDSAAVSSSSSSSSSSSFMSSASRRSGGGDDGGSGDDDDDDGASVGVGRDDDPAEGHDDTKDDDDDEGRRRLLSYVSRLEAIYEGGGGFVGLLDDSSDFFVAEDDVDVDVDVASSGRGGGRGRRVVLGDWLVGSSSRGGDEVCAGDSCGDDSDQCDIPEEYKGWNSGPRVDVMAFLGIRRAEPVLKASRDWD